MKQDGRDPIEGFPTFFTFIRILEVVAALLTQGLLALLNLLSSTSSLM